MSGKATNITAVSHALDGDTRTARFGHRGGVVWFTGLSGAGKSTIGVALEAKLFDAGMNVYLLDGDNLRHGLTSDLGFSPEDRKENLRRVGEVAALFANAGAICITALISPYAEDRARAREAAGGAFLEVYLQTGLEICQARDPKGLYKKALAGEIAEFTGVSAPYEAPGNPDLTLDTEALGIDGCVDTVVEKIRATFR